MWRFIKIDARAIQTGPLLTAPRAKIRRCQPRMLVEAEKSAVAGGLARAKAYFKGLAIGGYVHDG